MRRGGRRDAQRPRAGRRGGHRRAGALGEQTRGALGDAHRLHADGKHAEASQRFEQLARRADEHDRYGMAAHLGLQAARSAAAGGDHERANELTALGLSWAARVDDRPRAVRKVAGFVAELRANGEVDLADRVQAAAQATLGVGELPSSPGGPLNRAVRRRLPRSCPSCGAPVIADEVRSIDESSVECRYCGIDLLGR